MSMRSLLHVCVSVCSLVYVCVRVFKAVVGLLGTFHRGGMSNLALSGLAAKQKLGDVSNVFAVSVQ